MTCWRVSLLLNGRRWAPIIDAPDQVTAESRATGIFEGSPHLHTLEVTGSEKLHETPPSGANHPHAGLGA